MIWPEMCGWEARFSPSPAVSLLLTASALCPGLSGKEQLCAAPPECSVKQETESWC